MYLPQTQMPFRDFALLVRTTAKPMDLVEAVKGRLKGLDKDLPLDNVRTMEHVADASLGEPRLRTWLLGLFAVLALALASAGLYGLLAYAVARRTQEIGIRLAMGAERGDVLKLVMGQGLALTAIGIGLGLTLALGLARFLESLLYGVGAADPLTYSVVAGLLAGVAAAASYLPARRAASIEPAIALRRE